MKKYSMFDYSFRFSAIILIVIFITLMLLYSCKSDKNIKAVEVNFLINGQDIVKAESFAGTPIIENNQAIEVTVGEEVNFADLSNPADEVLSASWDVDNDGVPESTQKEYRHVFALNGTYEVKYCINQGKTCVSKYVIVKKNDYNVESTSNPTVDVISEPIKETHKPVAINKVKQPEKKQVPEEGEIEKINTQDSKTTQTSQPQPQSQPQSQAPAPRKKVFSNQAMSGGKVGANCKTDNPNFLKSSAVSLTPSRDIKLKSLKIFASKSGEVKISLTGPNLNKSLEVYANEGLSTQEFGSLNAVLKAGENYTLTVSSSELELADFGACATGTNHEGLDVDYTSSKAIFQIMFYY